MNMYDMPETVRLLLQTHGINDDWMQPEPLLLPLEPVPPLTRDMLPKVMADVVFDEAERMPCAPDMVAATMVVALGSIVGSSVKIRPKRNDNWSVVANLWGGVIGHPGTLKSSAITAGVKNVYRLDRSAHDARVQAESMANMQKQDADLKIKTLARQIKEAARKGPGKQTEADSNSVLKKQQHIENLELQLAQLSAQKYELPLAKRYYTNDATIESLMVLASQTTSGVLVIQDELMMLLMGFEKPGRETERQGYLAGWNGDLPLHTDRVSRGHNYVENFCISLVGGIQPDVFQNYMAQAGSGLNNDGLIQRLQLMVYPDPMPDSDVVDKSPDLHAAGELRKVFDALDAGLYLRHAKNDLDSPYFQFDDQAQAQFFAWMKSNNKKVAVLGDGMLAQHINKYRKLVAGLALIFHLVQVSTGASKTPTAIGTGTLDMAIAYASYLEAHARRIYGLVSGAKFRSAHALAAKIKSGELAGHITLRGVQRKGWSGLSEKEELGAAFAELEASGWIRKAAIDTGNKTSGRPPSTRYDINPKLLEVTDAGPSLTKPTKSKSRRKNG